MLRWVCLNLQYLITVYGTYITEQYYTLLTQHSANLQCEILTLLTILYSIYNNTIQHLRYSYWRNLHYELHMQQKKYNKTNKKTKQKTKRGMYGKF